MRNVDIVIVGAGPAGASAALAARQAMPGAQILLLDRQTFPRDKACGDAVAAHVLDELGAGVVGLLDDLTPTSVLELGTAEASATRPIAHPIWGVPRSDSPRVLWRLMTRKDRTMPAPRKYPDELKDRATRLALDARRDATTRRGAIARIAGQLDIHPEALRGWVRWAEAAASGAVAPTRPRAGKASPDEAFEEVTDRQRILQLEAKNRELTRANLILRQAATFFGAELDRQHR